MDELIVKQLSGNATDLEVRQVERWREASPENEGVYREQEGIWHAMGALEGASAAAAPAVAAVVEEAERRRRHRSARARGRAVLRSPWLAYGTAAAAVVALVSFWAGGDGSPDARARLLPVASSSGAGRVVTMDLSDGSVVRTAAATSVDFPAVADRREVVLRGRAFFAVAEGDTPFVVRTDAGSVTVHGTRFEVSTEDGGLRLVVVEGTVDLAGTGGSVMVGAGQVAYLAAGEAPRVVRRDDVWEILDWEGGLLLYQATPLGQVADEVGRHFGLAVRVDPALADRRITAWFEDETMDEVVSAICLVAGVRCEVGDSLVTMTGR